MMFIVSRKDTANQDFSKVPLVASVQVTQKICWLKRQYFESLSYTVIFQYGSVSESICQFCLSLFFESICKTCMI